MRQRENMKTNREIEKIFLFLIEKAEKYKFNVNEILEIPNSIGLTCFSIASKTNENLAKKMISMKIHLNSIDATMMTPYFKFPSLTSRMLSNGVNPFIIAYDEQSMLNKFPKSFTRHKSIKFPRAIHYSVEDVSCNEKCHSNCNSILRKFYYKEGLLVDMENDKRLGEGGFGMVFEKFFHGEISAMKCVDVGYIQDPTNEEEIKLELEKSIIEYRFPQTSSGSGIIIPSAIIRQQEQEKDLNGYYTARNYNIFVYPKYDCNLFQLHENHFCSFTNEILKNILTQCLTRKSSYFL